MNKFIFILSLGLATTVSAKLPEAEANRLVDAIYQIEGGAKTKYPYGIKSIDTKGDVDKARKICFNTVQNNHDRWIKAGKPGFYVDFLANKYCPPSADKQGNINWKKNVRKLWGEK